MSASTPVVSVGLPVYNGARWLDDAIRSILSQSYRDLELVIADNASTDTTREICEGWAKRDERVRYFRNDTNIGVAPNHNRVFELSRGRYFIWFAYDDLHLTDSLAERVKILDSHPEVVLAYTASEIIDTDGKIIPHVEHTMPLNDPSPSHRFALLLSNIPAAEAVLYGLIRRDVLATTTLERNCHGGDRCLFAELSLHGPFHKIPKVLFYRRIHGSNVATSQAEPWRFRADLSGKLIFPEWNIAAEHLRTIFRVPGSFGVKLSLIRELIVWTVGRCGLLKTELGFAWYYFKQRLRGNNLTLSPSDRNHFPPSTHGEAKVF